MACRKGSDVVTKSKSKASMRGQSADRMQQSIKHDCAMDMHPACMHGMP